MGLLQGIEAVLPHGQCKHIECIMLQRRTDLLPATYDQQYVLHVTVGAYQYMAPEGVHHTLKEDKAHALGNGIFFRTIFPHGPHDPHSAAELFALISGPNAAHSLGQFQPLFEGAQELMERARAAHVEGQPTIITGECQRPFLGDFYVDLDEFIKAAIKTAPGDILKVHHIPPDWRVGDALSVHLQ